MRMEYSTEEWELYREHVLGQAEEISTHLHINGTFLSLCVVRGFLTEGEKEEVEYNSKLRDKQKMDFILQMLIRKLDILPDLINILENSKVGQKNLARILRNILTTIRKDWEKKFGMPQTPAQSPIWITPAVSRDFVGRCNELDNLNSKLRAYFKLPYHSQEICASIIVAGMPGVGKSTLVAKCLSHDFESQIFNLVWIDANSKQQIRKTFVDTYEQKFKKSCLRNHDGSFKNDETIMSEVYSQLCQRRTVIVFDNAMCADPVFGLEEGIQDFLCRRVADKCFMPFYLVTTRTVHQSAWKSIHHEMLYLEPFDVDESWEYIEKFFLEVCNPEIQIHEENLKKLSNFLHCLPIALEHYMNILMMDYLMDPDDCDIDSFIRTTIGRGDHILEKSTSSYKKIQGLWESSISQIKNVPKVGNFADKVLEIMSVQNETNIPLEIIRNHFENSKIASKRVFVTAAKILKAFSLVKIVESSYIIHVLLQEYKRKKIKIPKIKNQIHNNQATSSISE